MEHIVKIQIGDRYFEAGYPTEADAVNCVVCFGQLLDQIGAAQTYAMLLDEGTKSGKIANEAPPQ